MKFRKRQKIENFVADFTSRRVNTLIVQLTAAIMKDNAWKKEASLSCIEYDIEKAIREVFKNKGVKVAE